MNDGKKAMDFFRPVRSTDPLVGRPKPVEGPVIIRRERITSLPPALKNSPNAERERDLTITAKAPVYSSSVIVEETIVSPVQEEVVKEEKPKSVKKDSSGDDWLSSLEAEGFFNSEEEKSVDEPVRLGKAPSHKTLYNFNGKSPFLKSIKVEKRPLSGGKTIEKKPEKTAGFPARPEKTAVVSPKKEKKGLPFAVTILITIILGIAAGIAVFVLISQ